MNFDIATHIVTYLLASFQPKGFKVTFNIMNDEYAADILAGF